jgi:hypothetical protein
VGHHCRRFAAAHGSVAGTNRRIEWSVTARIEQSLAQEVAIPLSLRVTLRQSIHVSLQCSKSLTPPWFDCRSFDLTTVMATGVAVIGVYKAGKGYAAGETASMQV